MPITIKNWKLAILSLLLFSAFIALGNWQLSRSKQKQHILDQYTARIALAPLHSKELSLNNDLRFHRLTLTGHFINERTLLLDNKIHDGKIGYEIYTPFQADGLRDPILVDRGFIGMGEGRKTLPTIQPAEGRITLTGMLNLPPTYVALGEMTDSDTTRFPLRVEYINLSELTPYIGTLSTPYLLQIDPKHPAAYPIKWEIVMMSPEKHMGYAIQWFAFAATLLILFVALNRR